MTKNRIKKIRLKNKIDQQELANALSLTQQAISQYENGKREPKLETWQKLADYFGVTVPYLQGISDIKDPKEQEDFNKLVKIQDKLKHGGKLTDTDKKEIVNLFKKPDSSIKKRIEFITESDDLYLTELVKSGEKAYVKFKLLETNDLANKIMNLELKAKEGNKTAEKRYNEILKLLEDDSPPSSKPTN